MDLCSGIVKEGCIPEDWKSSVVLLVYKGKGERQMQDKFRAKGNLYFGFVDLEKAFDRVPRGVIRWAMHKMGVEEWLLSAVMSMYTGAVVRTCLLYTSDAADE